ncbi:MAG: sulfur carrier protein ThiS [Bacteroidota bacterium]
MQITLNNRPEIIDKDTITISELLVLKKFTFKMLIIKINDAFIKKDDYDNTIVKEGDQVIVLHLISGG